MRNSTLYVAGNNNTKDARINSTLRPLTSLSLMKWSLKRRRRRSIENACCIALCIMRSDTGGSRSNTGGVRLTSSFGFGGGGVL